MKLSLFLSVTTMTVATIVLVGCKKRQANAEAIVKGNDHLPLKIHTLTDSELAAKSQQFRGFYKSLQDSDPREGPLIDTTALLAMSGAERDEAESLLIERIESVGGPVITALAELRSTRGVAALKQYAEKAGGSDAVEAALALWRMEKWSRAEEILIEVLEGKRKYFSDSNDEGLSDVEATGREDAARALGEVPTARSKKALIRALKDPEQWVRRRAQESLDTLK